MAAIPYMLRHSPGSDVQRMNAAPASSAIGRWSLASVVLTAPRVSADGERTNYILSGLLTGGAIVVACSGGSSDSGKSGSDAGAESGTTADASVSVDSGDTTPTDSGASTDSGAGTDTGTDSGVDAGPPTYSVGGSITGYAGSGLQLQDNAVDGGDGGDTITVAKGGTTFTFPTKLGADAGYAVTVSQAPTVPSQTCTPSGNVGAVGATNATTVAINCATNTYHVGGTVSGLSDAVTLQNNATDDLLITANGPFTFPKQIASGTNSTVTVKTQSVNDTCTLGNAGPNPITNGDYTNVTVSCVPNGLVYYYPLKANTKDASGNGYDLTNTGGTLTATDRNGNANSAYFFDGASANMVASGAGLPIGNGARTMTAWVNSSDTINNGASFRNYFHGAINDVRIYNRALTDVEVQTVYAIP